MHGYLIYLRIVTFIDTVETLDPDHNKININDWYNSYHINNGVSELQIF